MNNFDPNDTLATVAEAYEQYKAARSLSRQLWEPVATVMNHGVMYGLLYAGSYAGPNDELEQFKQLTKEWIPARERMEAAELVLVTMVQRTIVDAGVCTIEEMQTSTVDLDHLHLNIGGPSVYVHIPGRHMVAVRVPSGEVDTYM